MFDSGLFSQYQAAHLALRCRQENECKYKQRYGKKQADNWKDQKSQGTQRYRKGQHNQPNGSAGPFFVHTLLSIHIEPPIDCFYLSGSVMIRFFCNL